MTKNPAWLVALLCGTFVFVGCKRATYTPVVWPVSGEKTEVRGPVRDTFEDAQHWAISQARTHGPQASYIVYKNLKWDKARGMEIAEEKMR